VRAAGPETMASWVPCGGTTFGWREFSVGQDLSMSVEAVWRTAGGTDGVSAAGTT